MEGQTNLLYVVLGAVLVGIGLVFLRGDIPANFLSLLEWSVATYTAGHSVVHAAKAYTAVGAQPDVPPEHTENLVAMVEASTKISTELSSKVGELGANDQALSQSVNTLLQAVTALLDKVNTIYVKYQVDRLPNPPGAQ